MSDKESQYTSTGIKLLHHPEVIRLVKKRIAAPISLQISPTSICNLRCTFCSNMNRDKNIELNPVDLKLLLTRMKSIGLKTVEWTGGGDPTLYPYINDLIEFVHKIGLKQGFITNGLAIDKVNRDNLDRLYWLRISMNCLDYVESIEIPKIKGTLGFSYVMNTETTPKIIERLKAYSSSAEPKYVRIVPNCQATDDEQKRNNILLSEMVADWGEPFFYQAKNFDKPKNCWWGYYKPYLAQDGWVFPCSSVILNNDADYKFHENYRWCRMENLLKMYSEYMIPFNPERCNHCVFRNQNEMVESLLNPDGMEDFV